MTLRFAVVAALVALATPTLADDPPNPFACLGAYDIATRDHDVAQIRHELELREARAGENTASAEARAIDACVIAKLRARLGDGDAADAFESAIALAPDEPAYELFAGEYWSGARGARAPVLERAEAHYYRALDQLAELREQGTTRPWHAVVDDWVHKRLLVLYQQDGLPLLPWKAYPQDGRGRLAPGLFASSQLRVARDTRDFFHNSEMRQFTGEAAFASSWMRANRELTALERWNLARAPLRYQMDNRLRLRHAWLGALDLVHSVYESPDSQVTEFYHPTTFSNVWVQQLGGGFDRVLALGSLFDVRLAGGVRQVQRQGVIEFHPEQNERFWLYEARPSVSRFFGPNKLTIDGVYVRMDLQHAQGARDEQLRQKVIRGGRVDFAVYAPLALPSLVPGGFGLRTQSIRGLHLYAGAVEDAEVYGLRTVTNRDVYAGTSYGGNGRLDVTLQGTYYTSNTAFVDIQGDMPRLYSASGQYFSSARGTAIVQVRLADPDRQPGVPRSIAGFASDEATLVFPVHYERAIAGRPDYENFRGGAELWGKVFATGLGGTTFLLTGGYELQVFPRISKAIHVVSAALRIGWGEL